MKPYPLGIDNPILIKQVWGSTDWALYWRKDHIKIATFSNQFTAYDMRRSILRALGYDAWSSSWLRIWSTWQWSDCWIVPTDLWQQSIPLVARSLWTHTWPSNWFRSYSHWLTWTTLKCCLLANNSWRTLIASSNQTLVRLSTRMM